MLSCTLGSAAHAQGEGVLLSGTVAGPGGAITGVTVSVAGTTTPVITDEVGGFRILALSGRRFLHARAVGYEPIDTLLTIADVPMSFMIHMRRAAVQLDSMNVVASVTGKPARYAQTSKFDLFYERKATAIGGTFLTREDIERNGSSEVIDLLRSAPGIEIAARPGSTPLVRFARCTASSGSAFGSVGKMESVGSRGDEKRGPMQLFINGARVGEPLTTLAQLRTEEVEAMEIYRGVAQLPMEARGNGCAAIFIWTRYSLGSVLDARRP